MTIRGWEEGKEFPLKKEEIKPFSDKDKLEDIIFRINKINNSIIDSETSSNISKLPLIKFNQGNYNFSNETLWSRLKLDIKLEDANDLLSSVYYYNNLLGIDNKFEIKDLEF